MQVLQGFAVGFVKVLSRQNHDLLWRHALELGAAFFGVEVFAIGQRIGFVVALSALFIQALQLAPILCWHLAFDAWWQFA